MKKKTINTYQEKIAKLRQVAFLEGREYERLYQLSLEKDNARRIVIKWFSGLPLKVTQKIAEDVSRLLTALAPADYKVTDNK